MKSHHYIISFAALLAITVGIPAATPNKTTWINPGTGDWASSSNWDAGVPTDTLKAIINTGNATISSAAKAAGLELGSPTMATLTVANTGNLILNDAKTPQISAPVFMSGHQSTEDYLIIGTGNVLMYTNDMNVGRDGNASLINHGNLSIDSTVDVSIDSDGNATVINNHFRFGEHGNASLVNTGNLHINAPAHIGRNGTVSISNSGILSVNATTIRESSPSFFEIIVLHNHASWGENGTLHLINTGEIYFHDDKNVYADNVHIGTNGTAFITNNGSITAIDYSSGLFLARGSLANSTLLLESNSKINANYLIIANEGRAQIINNGSINAKRRIEISVNGTANVTLINNGRISSEQESTIIADFSDSKAAILNNGTIELYSLVLGSRGGVHLTNNGTITVSTEPEEEYYGISNIAEDGGNVTIILNGDSVFNAGKNLKTSGERGSTSIHFNQNAQLQSTNAHLTGTETGMSMITLNDNSIWTITDTLTADSGGNLSVDLNNNSTLRVGKMITGDNTIFRINLDETRSTAPIHMDKPDETLDAEVRLDISEISLPVNGRLNIPLIQTPEGKPAPDIPNLQVVGYEESDYAYTVKRTPDGTQLIITFSPKNPEPDKESNWINPGTGEWNTAANWDNGVPDESTKAIINTGNATISAEALAAGLDMGTATSISASLTINPSGRLLINDTELFLESVVPTIIDSPTYTDEYGINYPQGSTLLYSRNHLWGSQGNASLTNHGNLTIDTHSNIEMDGYGTAIVTLNRIRIADNGNFTINNTGVLTLNASVTIADDGIATINNEGTLNLRSIPVSMYVNKPAGKDVHIWINQWVSIAKNGTLTINNNGTLNLYKEISEDISYTNIELVTNGTATINSNGTINTHSIFAGNTTDSNLTINLGSNSTFNAENLYISDYGTAHVLNKGIINIAQYFDISPDSDQPSSFTNEGIVDARNILLGNSTNSTLSVTNNGSIRGGELWVAYAGMASLVNNGDITIASRESWQEQSLIGRNSTATLVFNKNATLSVDNITLSDRSLGNTDITLNDNSTWTTTDTLTTSIEGSSRITLNNNSSLHTDTLVPGDNTDFFINLDHTRTAVPLNINNASSTGSITLAIDASRLRLPSDGILEVPVIRTSPHANPSIPYILVTGFDDLAYNCDYHWNSDGSLFSIVFSPNTEGRPLITVHPVGASLSLGGSHNLSVIATGIETLSYQWHKNNIAIPGATSNTYSILNATPGSAGAYHVLVRNRLGQAVSNTATITLAMSDGELLSYALNPSMDNLGDTGYLPRVSIEDSKAQITFTPLRADLRYIIQASSDLQTWEDIAEVDISRIGSEVSISDTETAAPRRFLRLKILYR